MSESSRAPVMICCSRCKGAGQIELTGVYAETLELLRAQPGEISGAGLARLAGCTGEAMANRLVLMEAMGVVAGRHYGRERLWSVTHIQKREGTEKPKSPLEKFKREGREKKRRCEA